MYIKFQSLLLIILISSLSIIAQDKNAEVAAQTFLVQFNQRKFDDIYNSFSPNHQQKISKKDLQSYLNQIYGMAGKFKSATFVSLINGTYNYFLIAKNEDVNADLLLKFDQNNMVDYLNFKRIGGSRTPPPVSKIK
jgi:hypothetical protein